jgi:hypothetical protein
MKFSIPFIVKPNSKASLFPSRKLSSKSMGAAFCFSSLFLPAICGMVLCPPCASAATVSITPKRGAGFGFYSSFPNTPTRDGVQPFILVDSYITVGSQLNFTATGTLQIGTGAVVGPNGVTLTFEDHSTGIGNIFGALIGAWVPDTLANTPGFQPLDAADVAVGIPQSALFLIGSNSSFPIPSSGKLYVGISDSSFADNSGDGFQLNVQQVPEPSGFVLLGVSLVWLTAFRRRDGR